MASIDTTQVEMSRMIREKAERSQALLGCIQVSTRLVHLKIEKAIEYYLEGPQHT